MILNVLKKMETNSVQWRSHTARYNPLSSSKNKKSILEFAVKCTEMSHKSWGVKSDGLMSIVHSGGCVVAWTCMTASETG